MKSDRWTAGNVKLQAEASFAAERLHGAQARAQKLRKIMLAVGVAGAVATAAAAFISLVAVAVAGALAVVGFVVCFYIWSGANSAAKLAQSAKSTVQSEQKSWQRKKPRDEA